ncbi:hypothetical protein [Butyrivibrio sp. VCD2006]|uniref:hypothetical protein n=1 Tax=Butyrivibrio sp. VCD2006 TaxID=1280664 RepID=UPI000408CF92|nr:hypothetical protein [Butyrivibrio sp. VCD2006]
MNDKFEYLSDDELEKLISDTEASGLLQAPPGFEKGILDRIESKTIYNSVDFRDADPRFEEQRQGEIVSFDEKKKQFARFRFQVCMAMAAAILFMVVAPMAMNSENGRQIREATESLRTERSTDTNIVATFLGNHVISDSMASAGFGKNMED